MKGKIKEEVEEIEEIEETEEVVETEAEASNITCDIDNDVYRKVMHWIQKAKGEVSGLGKVEIVNGQFRVTSAILLEQSNTGATTEITAEAIGKAMFELKDEPGHLNWWWHSHVDFDVFWSGTDMDTIHELGQHGWFLSTVLNKMEEKKTSYYQKGNDFMPQIFVDDIPTEMSHMIEEDIMNEWDKDFDDKVKEVTFAALDTGFPGYPYGGHGRHSYEGATHYTGHDHFGHDPDYPEAGRFNDIHDYEGFEEIRDELVDETDYTEEEINRMILDEISRQEEKPTKKVKRTKAKSKKTKRKRKSA